MKISIRALRKLIREALLLEYMVRPTTTLYHRSSKDFKPGDILTAQTDPKTGKHWLLSKKYEHELERVRVRSYPDRPSRINCIYASFNARSRFLGKGKLYAIEPIGNTFVTDSKIIDQIGNDDSGSYGASYSLYEEYWEGVEPGRRNINDVEILMDSAKVIEAIEEKARLQIGTKIVFGPDAPTFKVKDSIAGSESPKPSVYASNGNKSISVEEGIKRIEEAPGMKLIDRTKEHIFVEIGPGFVGFLCGYNSPDPGQTWGPPKVSLSPGDVRSEDGIWLRLETPAPEQFIKAYRAGKIRRRD